MKEIFMTYEAVLNLLLKFYSKNISSTDDVKLTFCYCNIKTSPNYNTIYFGFLGINEFKMPTFISIGIDDKKHPYKYKSFVIDKRINKKEYESFCNLIMSNNVEDSWDYYYLAANENIPILIKQNIIKTFIKIINNPNLEFITTGINDIRYKSIFDNATTEELMVESDLI